MALQLCDWVLLTDNILLLVLKLVWLIYKLTIKNFESCKKKNHLFIFKKLFVYICFYKILNVVFYFTEKLRKKDGAMCKAVQLRQLVRFAYCYMSVTLVFLTLLPDLLKWVFGLTDLPTVLVYLTWFEREIVLSSIK